eukprot:COSAG03_NODE_26644_length_258_cov_0.509434_2_plen_49_part_01
MEGAIGGATHHDGMSGTEKQAVADDYAQRISEGHVEVPCPARYTCSSAY